MLKPVVGCLIGAMCAGGPVLWAQEDSQSSWSTSTDLRLRAESTDVPGRDEIERLRARLRLGVSYLVSDQLEVGGALRASVGSDDNIDNRRNLDNERSDAIGVDRLWMRWYASPDWVVTLGKDDLPLSLSPLLWDEDLRPIGVSSDAHWAVGDFDGMTVIVGYFAPDFLYEDDARLAAAQVGYHWREGAPSGASVLLSYLHFDDLDGLVPEGLSRTNRVSAGRLVSDFELLDLQLVARTEWADWPLELRLDLARNLGADDQDEAARISAVLGDRRQPQQWEIGLAAQRIQRDAVLAAASEDDWWFHSFARGVMPWVGYGFNEHLSLRLAAFDERRDDANDSVRRYLFDLQARW
ncbi:MAG: putative porin [Xanthomonadales bacterium]|nr:putative porin [Xanthomonadales bacterium]